MNRKNMKKYFMKGTDDEIQFGDMIELDLTKDLPDGKVQHHHLECKFIPELVPLLLEEGVVEEKIEEEELPLDFHDDNCPMMEELIKANETLEHRVYNLEKAVNKLKSLIDSLTKQKNDPKANAK